MILHTWWSTCIIDDTLQQAHITYIIRGLDEVLGLVVHLPHDIGFVEVCMVAVQKDRHVDVDYVPVDQRTLVGDAMTHHLRHGLNVHAYEQQSWRHSCGFHAHTHAKASGATIPNSTRSTSLTEVQQLFGKW